MEWFVIAVHLGTIPLQKAYEPKVHYEIISKCWQLAAAQMPKAFGGKDLYGKVCQ